ncbi:MAG: hypothetical protein ABL888_10965 [Pirellulaceae bacterium]
MSKILLALLVIECSSQAAKAQSSLRTDKQFQQYGCELSVEFQWMGLELREQVDSLCQVQRIGLWFDRQIDGSQTLELAVADTTLHQALWLVGAKCDAGVALLDDAFYFGPPPKAAALPNLLDDLKTAVKSQVKDQAAKRKLLAPVVCKGPAFQRPRDTIAKLAETSNIQIVGIEKIPLDVWQSFELPKRPALECLALCCYGFDLWPAVDSEGTVTIQPLTLPTEIRRVFPKIKRNMEAVEELAAQFPDATFSDSANGLVLEGSLDAINAMDRRLAFKDAAKKSDSAEKRFSLAGEESRGNLLATMAVQMSLELEFATDARPILNEVIKIDFREETIPNILGRIMDGTEWTTEVNGKKLKVRRK